MNTHSIRLGLIAVTTAAFGLAGCADMNTGMTPTTRNTAIGAGVGALAGAAIGGNTKGALIGAGVGAAGGYIWSRNMEQKRLAMERATMGSGATVTQTADNQLKLNVPSDLSFDTGRADIKPNMRPILDQFASGLANQPNTEVRIIGHTDSTGSDELNNRLSVERAQATRNYLVSRGVSAAQIQVAGRGEHEPVADNTSDAGRARNRRVEIFLGERNVAAR
ncbi:OmpA family protein [Ramlibacter alkalitolerans]|uniref:OmpA family protein n=1 Tax=Ramlibacter alkalitolerans TaxID=2039631 RepID=A0ABS1K097_9BURK|nr:OmpA family protein [Ramlibacter alkalitolerans]MBL0428790.1 OmpA family protein [Ramlibacter alkalitolerans]